MKCMKKRSFVNSARPRKTRFPELFLLAPLAIGCSFFPLQLATVRAEEAQQQSTSHVEQKIPPASELRELPPPEYAKLKSETLAKARAQVSPKIRNPKAPHGGLDPAVLTNLEQQRIYVQTHRQITGPSTALDTSNKVAPRSVVRPPISKAPNPRALAPDPVQVCLGPGIRSVNGLRAKIAFTPERSHQEYIIEGCFFGAERGQVQLEPQTMVIGSDPFVKTIILQVGPTDWTENQIIARIDPYTTGVNDFPVKLVIYPAKGQRMEMPGCSFSAVRDTPKLLTRIPSSWAKLDPTTVRFRTVKQLEYIAPVSKGGDVPDNAIGTSALVRRSDSEKFAPSTDAFDFSHLLNGWVVDSVQLQTYSVSCPGISTYSNSQGQWATESDLHSVKVTWQDDVCTSYVPPFFGFNMSLSQYALKVWVTGPIGTSYMPPNEH